LSLPLVRGGWSIRDGMRQLQSCDGSFRRFRPACFGRARLVVCAVWLRIPGLRAALERLYRRIATLFAIAMLIGRAQRQGIA